MSDDDEQYISMIEEDSLSRDSGINQLLDLAAGHDSASSSLQDQVLKFSNELASMTNRLGELSREKLQLEFENRELRARTAPAEIELTAAREELKFLKSQLQEYWTEIEKISTQKSEIYKERCEIVRTLTDEVSSVRADLDSEKHRSELVSVENERMARELAAISSQHRAREDGLQIEMAALKEKIEKQTHLIAVLEQQGKVSNQLHETIQSLEQQVETKSLEVIERSGELESAKLEIETLKKEKEELLSELIQQRDNTKARSTVDALLGKSGWSLSELVDALSTTKRELIDKRSQIDQLEAYVDEIKAREPIIEANHEALLRCQAELEDVRSYNEQIKYEYEKREEVIDSLKYEKMKLETDINSMRVRGAEYGKQIATLVQENEGMRTRLGLHAGPGRSNPSLLNTPFDSDKKKRMRDDDIVMETPKSAAVVATYKTVHDLVEQNIDLKDMLDRVMNQSELEAQQELGALRIQFEKISKSNEELVTKRETDRMDYDRTITRLESELKKSIAETDRLRKTIVASGFVERSDGGDETSVVLQGEFKRHLAAVNAELAEARTVCNKTASELDRVREDLKREIEEKSYYVKNFEKLKLDNSQMLNEHKSLRTRLNTAEIDRDNLSVKLDETRTQLSLLEKLRRELEHQVGSLKTSLESSEKAYKQLVSEKETQSAALTGYHSQLERESVLYSTNAEALKKLYSEELEKNRETLAFYQSAYEEQVKRGNELSVQAQTLHALVSDLRSEKERFIRDLEEAKIKTAKALVSAPDSPSMTHMQREKERLEASLEAAQQDVDKWRDLARVNESLADELRKQLEEKQSLSQDVNMESDEQIQELQSQVDVLEQRIAEKAVEIEGLRSRLGEIESAHNQDLSKLAESAQKVHELEEALRRERLAGSGKETVVAERIDTLERELEKYQRERAVLEQDLESVKSENDKYVEYFAENISDEEKEQRGNQLIAQLQASLAVHSEKEQQLQSDLARSRMTLDTLLRENQSLKPIVQERDRLLAERSEIEQTLILVESLKAQVGSLQTEHEQAEKLRHEVQEGNKRILALESEKKSLKEQIQAAQRMHEELSAKLEAAVPIGPSEELEQAKQEYAQLEKAKSQLTQTVSKLREEASKKTAEISALTEKNTRTETELKHVQDQLALREKDQKLKDKRISDLEAATAPMDTDSQVKSLMELVNEYQAALVEATLGKKASSSAPISPTSMKRRGAFGDHLEPAAGDQPEEPGSEVAPSKRARHQEE